jgi:CDP-diacylglycerol--glycerol-3-phosphate 3-phosphatidyltransferase
VSSQFNLANLITIVRILLIPVFLVLLFSGIPEPYGDIAAAAVFILAAATDKLDGYVARRNKQVTTLGQFLDPLADKLLIAAALIALVSQGRVAAWLAMVIIGREIAVSVLRIIGISQGVSIPADRYGKLKTVLQIVYVVYVLVPTDAIARLIHVSTDVATIIQWILAVVVVVVTLVSGVRYFLNARGIIRMPGSQSR